MIISRTPFRISFFGGGSDYPAWYRQHGGAVIGTAINKYCYLTVRDLPPFFEHKHRVVYSKVELPSTIHEIEHPAVRGVLAELNQQNGIEVQHQADLPARSGLGSSSSFTVGLLNAVNALRGKVVSEDYLAHEAVRIEQEVIKEHVGSQDQCWAAYGGHQYMEFKTDGQIVVTPLALAPQSQDLLDSHIMLFFTGLSRIASTIAAKKIDNLSARHVEITQLHKMAQTAKGLFETPHLSVKDVGELLRESWLLKRELADAVSNDEIDNAYMAAINAGAYGGKILGAGGGGFLMFLVPPERQQAVKNALKDLIHVDVKTGAQGSSIVMNEPNGFYER